MGPLISRRPARRACGPTSTSAERRASAATAPDGDGYWFAADRGDCRRPDDDRVWREEVFGPVVAVMPFDDEADAVAAGQRHRRTASPARSGPATSAAALRVARGVEAGNLSVNSHSSVRYWTPFGGFKQSGLGRELGPDALDAFTEVKNVFIAH